MCLVFVADVGDDVVVVLTAVGVVAVVLAEHSMRCLPMCEELLVVCCVWDRVGCCQDVVC